MIEFGEVFLNYSFLNILDRRNTCQSCNSKYIPKNNSAYKTKKRHDRLKDS